MKPQFQLTLILFLLCVVSSRATIITAGSDLAEATKSMKQEGYHSVDLWMEPEDANTKYVFWGIAEAKLIVLYSLKTKKISKVFYWRTDKKQTFDIPVKSFDTETGIMTITLHDKKFRVL